MQSIANPAQTTGMPLTGIATIELVIGLGGMVGGGYIGHHYARKSPILGTIVGVIAGGFAAAIVNMGVVAASLKSGSLTATPQSSLPGPGPAPALGGGGGGGSTTGTNANIVTSTPEVSSPYQTISTGPTQYSVTTASTGAAGQLRVRSGPGVSYALVGTLEHGSLVNTTGVVTQNPVDGYTWVEVISPITGNPYGWASDTYLTPTPSGGGTTTAGMVGLIPMIKPRAYAWG